MITLEINETELFNEETNEFEKIKSLTLQLEHSLVSLSKWESKWKKPFLSSNKTTEESIDYIKCMTINPNISDYYYKCLTPKQINDVANYISDPMTATTFPNDASNKKSREVITSELIYYWMISQNIPYDCRKWHLNQLLTLVRVCALKSSPPKKMNKSSILAQNKALNAERRAKLGTRG